MYTNKKYILQEIEDIEREGEREGVQERYRKRERQKETEYL